MTETPPDIRWRQRFENYERAFLLLRSALEERALADYSDLEKEGIIQRFEFTYELSWKVLNDYLIYSGIITEPPTPRRVIKAAFAVNIIKNGTVWIEMIELRNTLSHVYSVVKFEAALKTIRNDMLPVLDDLLLFCKREIIAASVDFPPEEDSRL